MKDYEFDEEEDIECCGIDIISVIAAILTIAVGVAVIALL